MTDEAKIRLDELKKGGKFIVGAAWCGPCQMLKAEFKRKGVEYVYVDADEEMEIAQELGIRGVPSCVVFNESGEEIDRLVGYGSIFALYVSVEG